MEKELYRALEEGRTVLIGTYEECLEEVGSYNEYGWYLPDWKDVGIIPYSA